MTVVGTGTIGGTFAGTADYKGRSKIPFILVHVNTHDGAATFLIKRDTWDEHFKHIKLGDDIVLQYSVVESNNGNVYVVERIIGLTDKVQ